MTKLILASNNSKKLNELRELLADTGIEVISQREAGCDFEVEESGDTFEENAYLKAIAVTIATKLPAIADDSGLEVDALNGEPGVLSARYTGSHDATDSERNELLLKNLEGIEDRSARFVSCVCCTLPNGEFIRARGECGGKILHEPRGENGFGYDPVFEVGDTGRSMAELSAEEKNAISHRGRALAEFKSLIKGEL